MLIAVFISVCFVFTFTSFSFVWFVGYNSSTETSSAGPVALQLAGVRVASSEIRKTAHHPSQESRG